MIVGRTVPPRSILPAGRSEFGRQAGRRLLALTVLLAMIMVGMCLTSAAMLWTMRRDAWKQAVTASRNVVAAETSSLEQTMRIYDGSLRSAAAAFGDPVVMALPAPLRQRALFDRIQDAAFLGPIRILDADGRVVADSVAVDPAPADGAELTALARHRARTDPEPALGPPVVLGAGGHAVTLSRRITRADGGFGGMVW